MSIVSELIILKNGIKKNINYDMLPILVVVFIPVFIIL